MNGPSASNTSRWGLAQIAPKLGDRDHNLQLHLDRIAEARTAGVELLVFPELSLTGYFLRDIVPEIAIAADGPELRQLASAAGAMDLVLGFVEESPQHRFYNAAAYFEAGQLRHVHRKVYLPTYGLFDERRYFAAGERIAAFDTVRFGRVGLLICEDFWHLSAHTILQAEGVDLVLCVSNSPARGVAGEEVRVSETYDRLTRTVAEMLGAAVLFADRVGYEDGLCFWGGSRIVGPDATVLAQAPHFEETLLTCDFDRGELRRARVLTPLARDEQLLLTLQELTRIKQRRFEQRETGEPAQRIPSGEPEP